jgi:hypothetical protein
MTTASILKSARNFAHEVLPPVKKQEETHEKSSQGAADVHHHHYHHGHGYWGYHTQPIFISNGCSAPSKKGNDDSLAAIIAVASIVILVSSYCIGSELGRRSDVTAHKHLLEDQAEMLKAAQESGKERTVKVLEIEKKMLDAIEGQTSTGLMTKTALLVSGVAALTGALVSSQVVIGAAAVGGAVSLGSTLVHWGYTDADTTVQEEAVRLLCAVDRAEAP